MTQQEHGFAAFIALLAAAATSLSKLSGGQAVLPASGGAWPAGRAPVADPDQGSWLRSAGRGT